MWRAAANKNPRSWKKVKWLPIFVDRSASFAGVPWLETGFALWQEEGMCFECDYLVPLPTNNREACVQFMADYTAMCFFVERTLLLAAPSGFSVAAGALLITPSACRTWTEHSERCWLSSVAAVLGIGRERREVLGRWRSNEYIRTAQRVVSQVQRTIVQGVLRDTEWQLQEIGIKDLELYLRQAGESDSLIYNQLCAFDLSLAVGVALSDPLPHMLSRTCLNLWRMHAW